MLSPPEAEPFLCPAEVFLQILNKQKLGPLPAPRWPTGTLLLSQGTTDMTWAPDAYEKTHDPLSSFLKFSIKEI